MSVLAITAPTSKIDQSVVQGSVNLVNGTWEKRDFARRGVINLYKCTNMGGADLSDQRAIAYPRLMRGLVWYFKVFFYNNNFIDPLHD